MASIIAEVRTFGLFRTRRMPLFEMTVGQGRDTLKCIWFNATYLQGQVSRRHDCSRSTARSKRAIAAAIASQIMQPQFEILHDPTERRQRQRRRAASGSRWRSAASFPSTKLRAMAG